MSTRSGQDLVAKSHSVSLLGKSRAACRWTNLSVEWHHGEAGSLPFADASFDVCLCQQGLQFFPDKLGALNEMCRVLVDGGRGLVSVVRSLEHNLLMSSQIEPLTRYLGAGAAMGPKAICSLGSLDELRALYEASDFREFMIEQTELTIRHVDANKFIRGLMMATPMASEIKALDTATQTALIAEIVEGFGDYAVGNALTFPHLIHMVSAQK